MHHFTPESVPSRSKSNFWTGLIRELYTAILDVGITASFRVEVDGKAVGTVYQQLTKARNDISKIEPTFDIVRLRKLAITDSKGNTTGHEVYAVWNTDYNGPELPIMSDNNYHSEPDPLSENNENEAH
jgi:hypothetical protein